MFDFGWPLFLKAVPAILDSHLYSSDFKFKVALSQLIFFYGILKASLKYQVNGFWIVFAKDKFFFFPFQRPRDYFIYSTPEIQFRSPGLSLSSNRFPLCSPWAHCLPFTNPSNKFGNIYFFELKYSFLEMLSGLCSPHPSRSWWIWWT